jgi:hypothetical protein
MYNETSPKIEPEIGPLLIYIQLLEVRVCWFLNLIHMSSQLCLVLSVGRKFDKV